MNHGPGMHCLKSKDKALEVPYLRYFLFKHHNNYFFIFNVDNSIIIYNSGFSDPSTLPVYSCFCGYVLHFNFLKKTTNW